MGKVVHNGAVHRGKYENHAQVKSGRGGENRHYEENRNKGKRGGGGGGVGVRGNAGKVVDAKKAINIVKNKHEEHGVRTKSVDVLNKHLNNEFGGPLGTFLITVLSPIFVLYLCLCVKVKGGQLLPIGIKNSPSDIPGSGCISLIYENIPRMEHYVAYIGFVLAEFIMSWIMPGLNVKGSKIKMNNSVTQLTYKCNAYVSWYVLLGAVAVLHITKIYDITKIIDNYIQYFIVASILAIAISILTYLFTIWNVGRKLRKLFKVNFGPLEVPGGVRMTGNHIYDFFLGAPLNPRIGPVDLKMFAEIRISWPILFLISVASLIKSYRLSGLIRMELVNLVIGHFLYANACAKGEHYIPATWDIKYEKWGYMVIYWNIAGVPFFYGLSSYFLSSTALGNSVSLPPIFLWISLIVMVLSYCTWDVSITQKCDFRQRRTLSSTGQTVYNTRKTIWLLPYSFLKSYEYMRTEAGEDLLLSGIWGYARKPHYTLDFIMALSWALNTGFVSIVPYIHPIFFITMLLHRQSRDEAKCAAKYGKDWVEYKRRVPYLYIPYVY